MTLQSHTPVSVDITPRNREHDMGELLASDWFDGHPFKTAWFNAMSITFPLGEKFFIDSVRHFADQVDDPRLSDEIRRFCGQEGFHRREHDRFNRELCARRGYDHDWLEGRIATKIAQAQRLLSPIQRLTVTAALEHITAIMAESALSDDAPMNGVVDPVMHAFWNWHAAEEMEHKSVAFDVYRAVEGGERMRKATLRRATWFLFVDIMGGVIHMLKRDGHLWKLWIWRDGWRFLFGREGILRRIWPAYRDYFRDGFHPWQRDTAELLEHWRADQGELPSGV